MNDNSNNQQQAADMAVLRELGRLQRTLSVPKTRMMRLADQAIPYRNAEDIFKAIAATIGEDFALVPTSRLHRDGGVLFLEEGVRLTHASGAAIESTFSVPVEGLSAQKLGTARSYAIKYALCNLFAIDDGIDDDTVSAATGKLAEPRKQPEPQMTLDEAIKALANATSVQQLLTIVARSSAHKEDLRFIEAGKAAKARLTGGQTA